MTCLPLTHTFPRALPSRSLFFWQVREVLHVANRQVRERHIASRGSRDVVCFDRILVIAGATGCLGVGRVKRDE